MYIENISKIGTLGNDVNDVTCSILAVKSLGASFDIVPFQAFELAEKSLIAEEFDAMVVPGAYPQISKFIMNSLLIVFGVYTFIIPPLVLASKSCTLKNDYSTLYNHPATNPLSADVNTKWNFQVNVASNTVACLEAIKDPYDCCVITNAACARRYGLYIHQTLREGINMPFIVFIKNRNQWNEKGEGWQ